MPKWNLTPSSCSNLKSRSKHGERQAVFRNGAADHAAGIIVLLEYVHFASRAGQFRGCRHATGAGADDGDPGDLPARVLPRCCFRAWTVFQIHDEALDIPNRHGFIEVAANTGLLAQMIANPAEYAGQWVVGPTTRSASAKSPYAQPSCTAGRSDSPGTHRRRGPGCSRTGRVRATSWCARCQTCLCCTADHCAYMFWRSDTD